MASIPKSTQEASQGRAAARTGIQAFIAAAVGLVVILPTVIDTFVPEVADILPAGWAAWLLGASAAIAAVSAAVAKVMAIPGFNNWLRRHRLLQWLAPNGIEAATAAVNVWEVEHESQDRVPGPDHLA